jgi:replicative DNA helicase
LGNEVAPAPPWNPDAERAVLGAVVLDNEQLDRCLDAGLKAGEFFLDQNRRIFRVMQELLFDGRPIDLVTLTNELGGRGELEASGGAGYVAALVDGLPRVSNVAHHARIVKEKARLRDLAYLGQAVAQQALGGEDTSREVLERAESGIEALAEQDDAADAAPMKLDAALKETMPVLERIFSGKGVMLGRSWGYSELDKITAGKQEAEFVILAARPSVGKTALGLELVRREAEQNGGASWVVSLEMTRLQIVLRLLCLVGRVDMHRMRGGYASQEDRRRIMEAVGRVGQWSVWISEPSRMTSLDLVRMTRRMAGRHDVKLVLVDYLQLLEVPGNKSPYDRVSEVSRHAKRAAKILGKLSGGTLVACAQLNRGAANDEPRLEHLRDSGQIEQDADTILFLWNEKVSDEIGQASALVKWLRVAKQRQGPTDAVRFIFLGQWMSFEIADIGGGH